MPLRLRKNVSIGFNGISPVIRAVGPEAQELLELAQQHHLKTRIMGIHCDGCGKTARFAKTSNITTHEQAREAAAKKGWTVGDGINDYCSSCSHG
jgi:hypothetical protein